MLGYHIYNAFCFHGVFCFFTQCLFISIIALNIVQCFSINCFFISMLRLFFHIKITTISKSCSHNKHVKNDLGYHSVFHCYIKCVKYYDDHIQLWSIFRKADVYEDDQTVKDISKRLVDKLFHVVASRVNNNNNNTYIYI